MGSYDDLIPKQDAAPAVGGRFADLIPTPEKQRADRFAKIAKAIQPPMGNSDLFGDSFTLGLQKPVAGLANMIGGKVNQWTGTGDYAGTDAGWGELYKAGAEGYDQRLQDARDAGGWAGTAASIAGALTPGAPGAALERGIMPLVRAGAEVGAVEGAARNSEDLGSAAKGAVKGGAAGGAVAGAVGLGGRLLPGARAERAAERLRNQGVPTDQLRANARALYRQLDNSGTAYGPQQAADFADTIRRDLVQNGWDGQGVHAPLNGVLQRIDDLRNGPMTLEQLQQIREQLNSNAGAIEPQVRRIAGRVIRNIDGFVRNETPAMSNLPPDQIGGIWQQARQAWRAANVADDIGWRVSKAERRAASTNSGQNTENAIRQNIRQVLDKAEQPTRYNPYSPEEIGQMARVVEGTGPQNAIRWTGNQLAGIPAQTVTGMTGSGLTFLNAGDPLAAGAAGLLMTGATTGAGHLLKSQSTRMAQNEADTLMRLITTGSTAPVAQVAGPPTRAALAELMRRQAVSRAAAGVMGNTVAPNSGGGW